MGTRGTERGVRPAGDRIEIRFTWQGKELRPTLNMRPSAANLKHAARVRKMILTEIADGTFNLANHFPEYRFAHRHVVEDDVANRTVADWFEVWQKLAARELEHSTLAIYVRHMRAYWLPAIGGKKPASVTHEAVMLYLAELNAKGLSRKTQNNLLIPLRGTFELACRTLKCNNPTTGVENLKVQAPIPDPFSQSEVDALLAALAKVNEEVADYFDFSFHAGLRQSEQIALLWSDVDLLDGTVMVRRARVLAKDKQRTKTHVERVVELNDRAMAVIQRQRSRTQLAGGHVFMNPYTKRPWNDGQVQGKAWTRAIKAAGVRYRPPKEARDTSVTLALTSGADPQWVAKQHGHSLQVMMKSYAKWLPKADRRRNVERVNQQLKAQ